LGILFIMSHCETRILVKKLNGGILPENFDFRMEVRSKRFNQMRITGVGEEKNLIKNFRLKI